MEMKFMKGNLDVVSGVGNPGALEATGVALLDYSVSEKSKKQNSIVDRVDNLNLTDVDFSMMTQLSPITIPEKKFERWAIDPTKLVLKSIIGSGAYAKVYKGTYDGHDVALKLLSRGNEDTMSRDKIEKIRNAFKHEAEIWEQLDHRNVTRFIGTSVDSSALQKSKGFVQVASNKCAIVLEYLDGGNLKDFLYRHRRKKLEFKEVIQLALDLSRGLEYLHARKIVHLDVKPKNILLNSQRILKIADFGMARVEASDPSDMTGVRGTLSYMAPEVIDGMPYNRKCDVYSFGICLWEIYCCDSAYLNLRRQNYHTVKILRPTIPTCCPPDFQNLMMKCWDKNPDERPEMSQVVKILESIHTSNGAGTIPLYNPFIYFLSWFGLRDASLVGDGESALSSLSSS